MINIKTIIKAFLLYLLSYSFVYAQTAALLPNATGPDRQELIDTLRNALPGPKQSILQKAHTLALPVARALLP
jgi:hypothetical protein